MSNRPPVLQAILRFLAALSLFAFTVFAGFGFLASNELITRPQRLPWQIGYTLLGGVCLSGAVNLLRRSRRVAHQLPD